MELIYLEKKKKVNFSIFQNNYNKMTYVTISSEANPRIFSSSLLSHFSGNAIVVFTKSLEKIKNVTQLLEIIIFADLFWTRDQCVIEFSSQGTFKIENIS
jgi:hypothetical protein